MAEVFQFPGRLGGAWRVVETEIRDHIRKAGGRDAMAEWILTDLRPRFEACHQEREVEVPTEAAPKVAEIIKFMHDGMSAAVLQMIFLEIELYAAKFNE